MVFLTFYPIFLLGSLLLSQLYSKILLMVTVSFGLIWIILFSRQFKQIFDIITIFSKKRLYPNLWPSYDKEMTEYENVLLNDKTHEFEIDRQKIKKDVAQSWNEISSPQEIKLEKRNNIEDWIITILILAIIIVTFISIRFG